MNKFLCFLYCIYSLIYLFLVKLKVFNFTCGLKVFSTTVLLKRIVEPYTCDNLKVHYRFPSLLTEKIPRKKIKL